jgi:hypothetical protein
LQNEQSEIFAARRRRWLRAASLTAENILRLTSLRSFWLRLLPSRLAKVRTSSALVSACRQFILAARQNSRKRDSALAPLEEVGIAALAFFLAPHRQFLLRSSQLAMTKNFDFAEPALSEANVLVFFFRASLKLEKALLWSRLGVSSTFNYGFGSPPEVGAK